MKSTTKGRNGKAKKISRIANFIEPSRTIQTQVIEAKKPKRTASILGLSIPIFKEKHIYIDVESITPVVTNPMQEKAKAQMRDKMMGKPALKRGNRDPEREFVDAMYWIDKKGKTKKEDLLKLVKNNKGRWGVTANAFKAACTNAAVCAEVPKIGIQRSFFVLGEWVQKYERYIVEIKTKRGPRMREDVCPLAKFGSTDLRWRPEFSNWEARLEIAYYPVLINPTQIMNILNIAGGCVGICEMRPTSAGGFDYGRFKVKTK